MAATGPLSQDPVGTTGSIARSPRPEEAANSKRDRWTPHLLGGLPVTSEPNGESNESVVLLVFVPLRPDG